MQSCIAVPYYRPHALNIATWDIGAAYRQPISSVQIAKILAYHMFFRILLKPIAVQK